MLREEGASGRAFRTPSLLCTPLYYAPPGRFRAGCISDANRFLTRDLRSAAPGWAYAGRPTVTSLPPKPLIIDITVREHQRPGGGRAGTAAIGTARGSGLDRIWQPLRHAEKIRRGTMANKP